MSTTSTIGTRAPTSSFADRSKSRTLRSIGEHIAMAKMLQALATLRSACRARREEFLRLRRLGNADAFLLAGERGRGLPQRRDPVRWPRHGRVAHQGQGRAQGGAEALRRTISPRRKPGMFVYTSLCKEDGGIFDDLVVFCLADNHYLLTMAAFNTHKTPAWVEKHTAGMDVCVMDMSAGTTCIEIQGPKSRADHAENRRVRLLGQGAALLPFRQRQDRRDRLSWSRAWA